MPATTWLHDSDLNQPTSNSELNELLSKVRKTTGENWQIIEYKLNVGPWYRRREKKMYGLYYEVMFPEFQMINFYREDTGTSINDVNEAGYVAAYLYGILAGSKQKTGILEQLWSEPLKPSKMLMNKEHFDEIAKFADNERCL